MTKLVLDSLQRRMRTMHSLYYQAVDSMELEHVNYFEREGVLPIAFSLFHYTNMQDLTFMVLSGELPIWNDEWQERVLDPARLTEVLVKRPFPPVAASSYSARVAGPEGITVLDGIECWHYQHGLRHMGEIELARGLVGLGLDAPMGRAGMTS